MAAVREATQVLGGTISIESSEGAGTTLRFQFPRAAITARGVNSLHPGARPSLNPLPVASRLASIALPAQ
jgi:hypothetical protein